MRVSKLGFGAHFYIKTCSNLTPENLRLQLTMRVVVETVANERVGIAASTTVAVTCGDDQAGFLIGANGNLSYIDTTVLK